VTKKKSPSAAVERFLAELRLSAAEGVLAALALDLAKSLEEPPPYARARIAAELRELVAKLEEAEANEPNVPRLVRGIGG
jgi:hypothetical protein